MTFSAIATILLTCFSALHHSPLRFQVCRTSKPIRLAVARNPDPTHNRRCINMPFAATFASAEDKINSPFGSRKSLITPDAVSGAEKRLGGTAVDTHNRLILLDSCPTESEDSSPSLITISGEYTTLAALAFRETFKAGASLYGIESGEEVVAVYSLDSEVSRPLWGFGISTHDFLQSNGKKELIVCSFRSL